MCISPLLSECHGRVRAKFCSVNVCMRRLGGNFAACLHRCSDSSQTAPWHCCGSTKHCAILIACAADLSKLAACRFVVKVVRRILRKPQVAHAFKAEGVTAEQCANAEQDKRVGVALDVLRSVESRLNNDIQGRDAETRHMRQQVLNAAIDRHSTSATKQHFHRKCHTSSSCLRAAAMCNSFRDRFYPQKAWCAAAANV